MTLCEQALEYVALGWAVFPCQPRSKEPVLSHGFKQATTDAATVREWWARMPQANIGLACGSSGLVVIDVDMPDGLDGWRSLVGQLCISVDTVTAITPTGGRHLFFQAPAAGAWGDPVVRNSTRRLGPGLDVRAAGGYVVAPPSVHPNGGTYRWAPGHSPFELAVAPLPGPLARRLQEGTSGGGQPATCKVEPGTRYARAALDREASDVLAAPVGGRNDRLNRAAFVLGRFVREGMLPAADVEEALGRAALQAGLEPREVAASVRSGLRAGMEQADATCKSTAPSTAPAALAPLRMPESDAPRSLRMPESDAHKQASRAEAGPQSKDAGADEPTAAAEAPVPGWRPHPAAFPLTDTGNGELIAALFGDRLRYNHDRSGWLIWDGTRWQPDRLEQVRAYAVEAARIRARDALRIAEADRARAVRDFAHRSENGNRVADALRCARTLAPIAVTLDQLDADPWLLGCTNGTLDLRTGELRTGDPEDLITRSTAAPFDPAARAPR